MPGRVRLSVREFRAGLLDVDASGARHVELARVDGLDPDREIAVEVALPDDLVFFVGRVVEVGPGPRAVIRLDRGHEARLSYVMRADRRPPPPTSRASVRVPVFISVRWVDASGEPHVDRLTDVSMGGAFVKTRRRPAVGSRIELQVPTDGMEPAKLPSRVRWHRDDRPTGFGVSFESLDSRGGRAVRALIQRAGEAA